MLLNILLGNKFVYGLNQPDQQVSIKINRIKIVEEMIHATRLFIKQTHNDRNKRLNYNFII